MKIFTKTIVALIFIFSVSSCVTSSDFLKSSSSKYGRLNNEFKDEFKTEQNPVLDSQKNVQDLDKELQVLKGTLLEKEYSWEQEKKELETILIELKEENKMLKQMLSSKSGGAVALKSESQKTSEPLQGETLTPGKKSSKILMWKAVFEDIEKAKYQQALSMVNELIKIEQDNLARFDAVLTKAMILYSLGDYKKSLVLFNQFLEKSPKNRRASLAWYGQGASFYQLGQKKDSYLFFSQARKIAPRKSWGKSAALIVKNKKKAPKDLFKAFLDWNAPPKKR